MEFNLFKRKKKEDHFQALWKLFQSSSDAVADRDATTFASLDLICSSFANLSGGFYNRETRQPVQDHTLLGLIRAPNYDETKFTFFYNSAKDYFNGNVYWYKYEEGGETVSLFRLNPNAVRVTRDTYNRKQFAYNGSVYTSEKIVHIPSRYGYNGLTGKSIFSECRAIFNITAEVDSYVNSAFNNAFGKRLIIDITRAFPDATDEQIDQLRDRFMAAYGGAKNAGKPLIKNNKVEYTALDADIIDNRSKQLIENRAFQEKEITKLFGIPLSFLDGSMKGDIESLYTIYIENAIKPLATEFEQAINKLVPISEQEYVYFEYSYNSLLKTSLQNRIDAYVKQITNGMLSLNEVRRKENNPEIEAGDTHFVAANLMPLRQDIIDSYMAGAKMKELQIKNTEKDATGIGDDKK